MAGPHTAARRQRTLGPSDGRGATRVDMEVNDIAFDGMIWHTWACGVAGPLGSTSAVGEPAIVGGLHGHQTYPRGHGGRGDD
jgi:hypothetical protein